MTRAIDRRPRLAPACMLLLSWAAAWTSRTALAQPANAADAEAPLAASPDRKPKLERFEARSTGTTVASWVPAVDVTLEACGRLASVVHLADGTPNPPVETVRASLERLSLPGCASVEAAILFCENPSASSMVPAETIDDAYALLTTASPFRAAVLAEDVDALVAAQGGLDESMYSEELPAGATPEAERLWNLNAMCVHPAGVEVGRKTGIAPLGTLQDTLIRGLAAFISARLDAELELMVQERIADDLCTKKVAESLLPSSCGVARELRDEDAPLAWGTIRAALQQDLEDLPINVLPLLVDAVPKATHTEKAAVTLLSLVPVLLRRLQDRGTPLTDLGALDQIFDAETIEGAVLRRAAVIVQVVVPKSADFLPPDGYAEFGRLAAAAVAKVLELPPETDLDELAERLIDLRIRAENLRAEIKRANEARSRGEPRDETLYGRLAIQTIELFTEATSLALSLPIEGLTDDTRAKLDKVVSTSPTVVEAITAAQDRDYATLLTATLAIVRSFETELGAALPESVTATLRKYGPFLVELASAKDADAVEHALEAAAAPVGSYRIKRGWSASLAAARMDRRLALGKRRLTEQERTQVKTDFDTDHQGQRDSRRPFTVSLNAFAGAKAGGEWLLGSTLERNERFGGHVGLFMPVGIDLAWGVGAASSLQLFTSIIDVGALGDFRLGDDDDDGVDAEAEPRIGLAQVFSPGMYFVYGIHRTPLAIGAGASFAPQYRRTSLDPDTPAERLHSTVQVSGFLAVDIPMFVIHRRGGLRRKKTAAKTKASGG